MESHEVTVICENCSCHIEMMVFDEDMENGCVYHCCPECGFSGMFGILDE